METHELLCNHLAPKLKGRPRGRRKKAGPDSPESRTRGDSPGSESATSEISACSVEKVYSKYSPLYVKPEFKQGNHVLATRPQLRYNPRPARSKGKSECETSAHQVAVKSEHEESDTEESERSEKSKYDDKPEEQLISDEAATEELEFFKKLLAFHSEQKNLIPKSFWFGIKRVNLLMIYNRVQNLGGYQFVTEKKLWKYLFGANSTPFNTITRKKYERALLPFENFERSKLKEAETTTFDNIKYEEGVAKKETEDCTLTVKSEKDVEDTKIVSIIESDIVDSEKISQATSRCPEVKLEPSSPGKPLERENKSFEVKIEPQLSVAEMCEIQRKIHEKDSGVKTEQHEISTPVTVPVTVILRGSTVECHTSSPSQINIQQPHTTITVHQTTIHPQSFSHEPSKNYSNQQIQITNQIQIQQITVKSNSSGTPVDSGPYTCSIKQDKNGQEVQIETPGDSTRLLKRQSSVEEFSGRDGSAFITHAKISPSKTSSLRHVRVKADRARDIRKPHIQSQTNIQPNESKNIPYLAGSKTTTITPILGNSNKNLRIQSPEIIDLVDSDTDSSSPVTAAPLQLPLVPPSFPPLPQTAKTSIFPNMKKRKLEILREGGLEVTAISNTGGLIGSNMFGPQISVALVQSTDDKPLLRPEIVGSIPSVNGTVSPNSSKKTPTPKFQSKCMYTKTSKIFGNPKDQFPITNQESSGEGLDLTVKKRGRKNSVEILRLPSSTTVTVGDFIESKIKSDPSLQITLVPPMTHVQNIHNSQNYNINKRRTEMPSFGAPSEKKSTTPLPSPAGPSSSKQVPLNIPPVPNTASVNLRPNLNIPTFPPQSADLKINSFLLQHIMAHLASKQQHIQQAPQPSAVQASASNASTSNIPLIAPTIQSSSPPQPNPQGQPTPFVPFFDPIYLSALYANPALFFPPTLPPELLQLYKNFPLEPNGKVPVSKS